jgi:hypothetical protein
MNEQKYSDITQEDRSDLLERKDRRVKALEAALKQLKSILEVPASNRVMMQIAGPARRCLNIIKSTEGKITQPL